MCEIYSSIKNLIEIEEWEKLESLILTASRKKLFKLIQSSFSKESGILLGILKSLSATKENVVQCKFEVYLFVLPLIKGREGSDEKENGALAAILNLHLSSLQDCHLVELVDVFLEHLQRDGVLFGRWTDVLSQLISRLSSASTVRVGVGEQTTGEELRSRVLKTFWAAEWDVQTATCLLSLLKDLKLSPSELEETFRKTEQVLHRTELSLVAPIAYHLILAGQEKAAGKVLSLLTRFFDEKRAVVKSNADAGHEDEIQSVVAEGDSAPVREAEGAVVFHVCHLAQYQPNLVKEFVKSMKCIWVPESLFSPFNLSLALALSHFGRFKDQVLESLKAGVINHYRMEELKRGSAWMSDLFSSFSLDVSFRFKEVMEGWNESGLHAASEGMMSLCFLLLECGGGGGGAFKKESWSYRKSSEVAVEVLPCLLKKDARLAPSILRKVSNLLLSSSEPLKSAELLMRLVKRCPMAMLDHSTLVREYVDQLPFLPDTASTSLLSSLLPLAAMDSSLKDALVLVLRKMLFSKTAGSRVSAVRGLCRILCRFRLTSFLPSSQASSSFASSLSQWGAEIHVGGSDATRRNTVEILCLEILGVLRRALTQQVEVRRALYVSIKEVVRANPKLLLSVLQFLHQHLMTFVDLRPEVTNPIRISKIVSTSSRPPCAKEPLGELLMALSFCTTFSCRRLNEEEEEEAPNDDDDDDERELRQIVRECDQVLTKLARKMCLCEFDDFVCSFRDEENSNATAVPLSVVTVCELVVGVLDGLIDHRTVTSATKEETIDENEEGGLFSLVGTRRRIMAAATNSKSKEEQPKKNKSGGGGDQQRKSAKGSDPVKGFVSLEAAALMLDGRFRSTSSSAETYCELWSIAASAVHSWTEWLSTAPTCDAEASSVFAPLTRCLVALFVDCERVIVADKEDEPLKDSKEVCRINRFLGLILAALETIFKRFRQRVSSLIRALAAESRSTSQDAAALKLVLRGCALLRSLISDSRLSPLVEEASVIVPRILALIVSEMRTSSKNTIQVRDEVDSLCRAAGTNPLPAKGAEALVRLLLVVGEAAAPLRGDSRSVARDIHLQFGDIEGDDVTLDGSPEFAAFTEVAAPHVLCALCAHCEEICAVIEVALKKFKACVCRIKNRPMESFVDRPICMKLVVVAQTLMEVTQSHFPVGPSQDAVLRLTSKFFWCLKGYVVLISEALQTRDDVLSSRFEKLVGMCGTELKERVFNMLTFVCNSEDSALPASRQTRTGAARVGKESRLIPGLVYAVEQCEKELLLLARKSKVDLLSGTKITTSRDFRIHVDALREAVGDTADNEGDTTTGSRTGTLVSSEDEREPPPTKKRKV